MKLFGLIFIVIILVGIAMSGSFVWDSFLLTPTTDAVEVSIKISEGMSVNQIAVRLEEEKLIKNTFFFKAFIKLFGSKSTLQAGEHTFKQGMSYRALVNEMSHAGIKEIQMTFPEGFTTRQIGQTVTEALPSISDESWQVAVSNPSALSVGSELLAGIPSGQGLEGYLFPDTYRFRADADAKTILETMVLTLSRRLAEGGIVVPSHLVMSNGMTLHEVLTLASIVEREVRSSEDMARVAGIFLTRMKIGMALQADATVNYVTGKKDAAVSLEDSRVNSLYNTYTNLGLPPGPISNPGLRAIVAVLSPIDSNYLYYLTSEDGTVHYAKTFDEHIANKYKYLK